MKSVEQEVWMKLHLERLELRLGKLSLQPGGSHFAVSVAPLIIECIADQQNQPVDHRAVVRHEVDIHQQSGERELAAGIREYIEQHQIVQCSSRNADQNRRAGVNRKAAQPLQPLYGKTSGKS